MTPNESPEPNSRGTIPLLAEDGFEYPRYARCSVPTVVAQFNRYAAHVSTGLCGNLCS